MHINVCGTASSIDKYQPRYSYRKSQFLGTLLHSPNVVDKCLYIGRYIGRINKIYMEYIG